MHEEPVKSIREHAGNKYLRTIHSAVEHGEAILVDVYAVLKAFGVTCPARQHAIKKLLCAGLRDKGSALQDLTETLAAVSRAIQLHKAEDAPV